MLDSDAVKFLKLYEIRWLSLGNSITALIRNYEPLIVMLEADAEAGMSHSTSWVFGISLCIIFFCYAFDMCLNKKKK